jgi:hypothetical protein
MNDKRGEILLHLTRSLLPDKGLVHPKETKGRGEATLSGVASPRLIHSDIPASQRRGSSHHSVLVAKSKMMLTLSLNSLHMIPQNSV